ncbi:MAG: translation initiation factor IF-2, partial [Defluviitaleaceae bacterium]|nr:translation initiation factor IF-2 [Defluviitaleaceae bacterium]
DRPRTDRPQGDRPRTDNRPYGERNQGQRPQGDRPRTDRPQGDRPRTDNRPYGERNQGQRPQGDKPYGDRSQNQSRVTPGQQRPAKPANTTYGDRRPADRNKSAKQENKRFEEKQANKYKKYGEITRTQRNKDKKKAKALKEREDQRVRDEEAKSRENDIKTIQVGQQISVRELSEKLGCGMSEIITPLMKIGIMANATQEIDFYTATNIAELFDVLVEPLNEIDILEEAFGIDEDKEEDKISRPPVVVVMGHVDHGKTSLLDAIRSANIAVGEAGGITQKIGAYQINTESGPITFLDTPGHEAFTAMRMRGAKITDIAVLVVAADDGVMPQTIEAINHAKAAEVEIIVAINKIDKQGANPDRVKQELSEYGIVAEEWGGSHICVPVSARQNQGIKELLDTIILVSDLKELKANPNKKARGTVIEANLDRGRGPVATILVQAGTLNIGDPIVAGSSHGKVRAMVDHEGTNLKKIGAGPSMPVEITGLSEVPKAGDSLYVANDEKHAASIAGEMIAKTREDMLKGSGAKVSLDDLFNQIREGNIKELNLLIKADVQGSVEAVRSSLEKLSNEEVRIKVIHGGVGHINESDIMLASASGAIVIGFNVSNSAKSMSESEGVDVRLYKVIYNAIEDISFAMKGMLDPVFEEKVIGNAEIRQLFKSSGVSIAGSYVLDGKITRNSKVRIFRDSKLIYEGEIAALRRFQDDVKEVNAGYEFGLTFEKFNDLAENDKIEAYIMEEVKR